MAQQDKPSHPAHAADSAARVDASEISSDTALHLADHFLIAMPNMLDPVFGGTVVYICEHHAGGALGMIINRPTDMSMELLFERLELALEISPHGKALPSHPVMFGGPVQVERGFVLHAPDVAYSSSLLVSNEVALTTSRDVLEAAASGHGPTRLMVTLGCAGWGAGQLEEEILRNGWLTVKADPSLLFDTPIESRFYDAMQLLGVDPNRLTGDVGHA